MKPLLAGLVLLALVACDDMARQEKLIAHGTTRLFADGSANRLPPEGSVARGDLPYRARLATRPPMSPALLERGRERFDIYCSPCHGLLGDGQGVVTRRGFPSPPSLHLPRLRQAPERHFMTVIDEGYGQMYGYAARVAPPDRWAIVAYIRALQLSQGFPAGQLGAAERAALEARP